MIDYDSNDKELNLSFEDEEKKHIELIADYSKMLVYKMVNGVIIDTIEFNDPEKMALYMARDNKFDISVNEKTIEMEYKKR